MQFLYVIAALLGGLVSQRCTTPRADHLRSKVAAITARWSSTNKRQPVLDLRLSRVEF